MRRALLVGLSALVLLGAGTTLLLHDEDRAPLPSRDELRTNGFAVWPEDTIAEGMDACQKAESWRLDPKETAFRFAGEVLRYPEPILNTDPIVDEEREAEEIRYLIGSRGVRGVFLGSVIDVRKYDRCWFVVNLQPREEGWLPSIGYIHGDAGIRLALRMEGPPLEIGYGGWQQQIAKQRGQVVLDLPELEPDVTGHIMTLGSHQQVLDGSASPLGSIPEPATTQVSRVARREVAKTPRVCGDDAYRQPQAAIADLYTFTLGSPVGTSGRKVLFERGEGAEHAGDDRWLLHVDEAKLTARIPELKGGCRRILFIDNGRRPILRSLQVEPGWFTFELNWGNASSADIWLISASGRGKGLGRFDRIDGPLTVRNEDPLPMDEPFHVTVVLRKGREVISAERSWYRASRETS